MDGPYRKFLFAKLHGMRVTAANTKYEGSITIASDLLDISGLRPHEAVQVWNVTSGTRFETYILEGEYGSRECHVNGAAAHMVTPGDIVIVASFIFVPTAQIEDHEPRVVFMNPDNSVKSIKAEKPKTLVS